MGQGRPFIPQHDQKREGDLGYGPWSKYLKYFDRNDPARYAILKQFRLMELSGVTITPETAEAAVRLGRFDQAEHDEQREQEQKQWARELEERRQAAARLPNSPEGIVYYIRRGKFIKIGTTTRPRQRFAALMPDEILAVEPGSYTVEAERHAQFVACQVAKREYFHPEPELIAHIRSLREEHGVPEQTFSAVSDGLSLLDDQGDNAG